MLGCCFSQCNKQFIIPQYMRASRHEEHVYETKARMRLIRRLSDVKKLFSKIEATLTLEVYVAAHVTGCKSQGQNITLSDPNVNVYTETSVIDNSAQATDEGNILFNC